MTATPAAAPPIRGDAPVLAIILASYFMIVLDISIVITALPRLQADLAFTPAGLSWVQSAYTLAFGGFLLLGARAGDLLGRRRVFVAGLAVFVLASLAIGAAPSAAWLVTARFVQGTGAAILAPATLALLTAHFPPGPGRTRAVAFYGAVAGVGASLGLVLGGILADALSWRVGFFLNLPIGLALILAAWRHVAETPREVRYPDRGHPDAGRIDSGRLNLGRFDLERFDLVGALASTLGMGALVLATVRSAETGWGDPATFGTAAAGLALLGLFVAHERRAARPIMPPRLFASRERAGAYAARVLFLGAMMGFWFFVTQFLQDVRGDTPFQAGLAFLPMTLANFAVALAVPALTRRLGNGPLLAAGVAVTLAGMAWLSRLSAEAPYLAGIALPMVLIGIGQGASLSPLTAAGIAGVPPEDAGAASGLVNVAHQIGGSLGLAVLVAIAATATPPAGGTADAVAQRAAAALTGGTAMLAVALALVVLLILRQEEPARRSPTPQARTSQERAR